MISSVHCFLDDHKGSTSIFFFHVELCIGTRILYFNTAWLSFMTPLYFLQEGRKKKKGANMKIPFNFSTHFCFVNT